MWPQGNMIDQCCSCTQSVQMQKTGMASHKRGNLITTTFTTGAKEAKEEKAKGAREAKVGNTSYTGLQLGGMQKQATSYDKRLSGKSGADLHETSMHGDSSVHQANCPNSAAQRESSKGKGGKDKEREKERELVLAGKKPVVEPLASPPPQ